MKWRAKPQIALLVAPVTIVAGLLTVLIALWVVRQRDDRVVPPVQTGSVTIDGRTVCLPHKQKDGPQTMECAFGVRDASGKYYGLKNLPQPGVNPGLMSDDKHVRVKGALEGLSTNEIYDVAGNILVESIIEL